MPWSVILSGRVQGVGCRYYCAHAGRRLNISGAASNCDDGTVQVILDTEDKNKAQTYAEAVAENTLHLIFFGRIDSYELRKTDEHVSGDYAW